MYPYMLTFDRSCIISFGRRYTNCLRWVVVVSSWCIVLFFRFSTFFILRHDVQVCGNRVSYSIIVYVLLFCILFSVDIFIFFWCMLLYKNCGVKAGDVIILIPICILGGWDWPGGSALEYVYVWFYFILHQLAYSQHGWNAWCPSNRRVMSDFLENLEIILKYKKWFQEINWIKFYFVYLLLS